LNTTPPANGSQTTETHRPLSERDRELLRGPTIASQFPVVFSAEKRWDEMTFFCCGCDEAVDSDLVRGTITRPVPQTAVLEAAGICADCNLVTTYSYRMHSDMRLSANRAGKWVQWSQQSQLENIKDWLLRLVSPGKPMERDPQKPSKKSRPRP